METTLTINEIIFAINQMSEHELVILNNEYCDSINGTDSHIFYNDEEFFETFFIDSPMKLAQAICFGDYQYYHEYIKFNGYGNLETFQRMSTDQLCECVPTMAEYISENFNDFYNLF